MSGGSYNYLFLWEDDTPTEDLEAMVARLEELGLHEESLRTETFLQQRLHPNDPLRDLWRAIEWRDSGDWSDETLAAKIAEYRAKTTAAV